MTCNSTNKKLIMGHHSNTLGMLSPIRSTGKFLFLLGTEAMNGMARVKSLFFFFLRRADSSSCSLKKKQGEVDSLRITEYQF